MLNRKLIVDVFRKLKIHERNYLTYDLKLDNIVFNLKHCF